MSKRVIEDVSPSYGSWSGNVSSINQSYTTVADSSDITDAKRELNGTINDVKKIIDKKLESLNEKINQIDGLPDDIRNVIETTNNQQALLLRNVYREISENLSKQQKAINDSCTKATGHIQQLAKERQIAESMYSNIQRFGSSLNHYRTEISSVKTKVKWLFALLLLCVAGFVANIIMVLS